MPNNLRGCLPLVVPRILTKHWTVAQSKGELPLAHMGFTLHLQGAPLGRGGGVVTGMRGLLPFWSIEAAPQSLLKAALVTQSAWEQRF